MFQYLQFGVLQSSQRLAQSSQSQDRLFKSETAGGYWALKLGKQIYVFLHGDAYIQTYAETCEHVKKVTAFQKIYKCACVPVCE